MTPVAIATEDELSEAVALRLVAENVELDCITHKLRKGGFGYLRSRMESWCQMSEHQVMLVLTDLDKAKCLVEMRDEWLGRNNSSKNLVFRIVVREIEAWVLSDHKATRNLIGTKGVLPFCPDDLIDPKQTLLSLVKGAPKVIRDDLLRVGSGGVLAQGLGYNARLVPWIKSEWDPARAAERSPSLARTRIRLREAITNFL